MTTFFETQTTGRRSTTHRLPAPEQFAETEPRLVAGAVQAAVQSVDEGKLESVARLDTGQAIRPKLLLALLCFCYARQTYGSKEVLYWLRQEVNFRHFDPDEFPDALTLARFRRENREALHHCLRATLRFLGEQRMAAGLVTKVSEAQLAEEASRRIIMAMFIDSMELEAETPADAPVDLCYLFANGRPLAH